MFRVKEAQLKALEAHYAEEFVEAMTDILFDAFPEECSAEGRAAVLDFVRASAARARGLGATLESDLRRYVTTDYIVGTEVMPEMIAAERARLIKDNGEVDPTILIFRTYQAMLARLEAPAPSPVKANEVIA
jgi:hypothetical protein